MRKLFAIAATCALLLGSASGTALANHKNQGKGPHPAGGQDCAIEVDPLGVCLDL